MLYPATYIKPLKLFFENKRGLLWAATCLERPLLACISDGRSKEVLLYHITIRNLGKASGPSFFFSSLRRGHGRRKILMDSHPYIRPSDLACAIAHVHITHAKVKSGDWNTALLTWSGIKKRLFVSNFWQTISKHIRFKLIWLISLSKIFPNSDSIKTLQPKLIL